MPLFIEIVLIVLSAILTFSVSMLIRKINKRDERAEERQQELISCRFIEMKYTRSIGSLSHCAAKEVQKAKSFPIGNGDLDAAIKYYKEQEHELEDFYQKANVVNNVRGG